MSDSNKVARQIYPEDAKPGQHYIVGGTPNKFIGWKIEDGPRMVWEDLEDGFEWEAYMFKGRVSFGSSASPLVISGEHRMASSGSRASVSSVVSKWNKTRSN